MSDTAITTVRRMREAAKSLRQMADELDDRAAGIEGRVGNARIVRGREILKRLREIMHVGDELHYVDMTNRLTAEGFRPSGQDPAATLLASVAKAKDFVVTAPRSGIYRRVR